MIKADANDPCGTDIPGTNERLACFKCAHDMGGQCDYRRTNHVRRLESLHRRWETLVGIDLEEWRYCKSLHDKLDEANAALALDPQFCEECAHKDCGN